MLPAFLPTKFPILKHFCTSIYGGVCMFQACNDPILEFRRQGSGKHMGRAQLFELFDVLETMGPKAQPSKNKNNEQLWNSVLWEGLRRGIWKNLKPVWSPLYLSICLSLSILYLSIDYISISLSLRRDPLLPETSITITLVSCYIGSESDPFPLCLDKNVNGMRRSVTTANSSQKHPLYKIRISGPTNRNIATNIAPL